METKQKRVKEGGVFFPIRNTYTDEEKLCCILNYHNAPSLYRGGLQLVY